MFSGSPLLFIFPAAALSSCSSLLYIPCCYSAFLLLFIFPAAALSFVPPFSLYSLLLLCSLVLHFSLYSLLLLCLSVPLFSIFTAATLPSFSSLYIPCCCYVLLFSPSLYIPCCYSVFLFLSSLYSLLLLLCLLITLFIFPAAALSFFLPYSLYSLLLLCPLVLSFSLLAHLSRRLIGELIVYQSLRRPSVVCRPSSVRPQFQTSSPLKPLGQLNSNFIWRLLRMGERKFVQMVLVT